MRTAECVSAGHPDKICDQISDAILDECLRQDPMSRVAVETMGGHGKIFICGEVTTKAEFNAKEIAIKIYRELGYEDEIKVISNIVKQSPDIACGVDTGGAGDQGIMVGYACNDNEQMIPQELYLARKILSQLPKNFGPDAKCQVTLDKKNNIETIVLSAQHTEGQNLKPLENLVKKYNPKKYFVNPTGKFVIGGFFGDTGLTGRKLAVDNYGPQVPIGGGAFSGKDPSKVDRSAAYMARRVAVDLLKEKKAKEVLVKIAYSIGIAEPVMAIAEIDGKRFEITGYDLTPQGIIKYLDLRKPIYLKTAKLGHFGNNLTWDK
ncbi:TPA: methionine adenosyltransferase [Candidatus Berkelbacteria bacterium]|uniref:Methionine adenosyltransferase n=1 Tax=Berkelbacteria bacterium GW2011_GWE1_39_12 TaxID=1618337 RepID=A0A0G4B5A6_9BACT|nr:MAG: S-adenosylmethionine synthetase [Berkelbacteria bacterium GW2011_GWE1_39_12]HBO60185.1 methionine adenosyltransferase [Candidatus Berkelbacteria bacterium]